MCRWLDADPGGDAGELGVVGDARNGSPSSLQLDNVVKSGCLLPDLLPNTWVRAGKERDENSLNGQKRHTNRA